MKKTTAFTCFISLLLVIIACNKKDVPDPCLGVSYKIQYIKSEAIGSLKNGSITITFPFGDSISYSLNNGTFQATNTFSSLAPGNYIVTVKNLKGCTDTTNINIPNYGPKYALVKHLVSGYCGPCHLNNAVSGGKNFDSDNTVVSSWDRIKIRTVDGTPTFMPENSQLTTVDKNKILDWINAGHRISD